METVGALQNSRPWANERPAIEAADRPPPVVRSEQTKRMPMKAVPLREIISPPLFDTPPGLGDVNIHVPRQSAIAKRATQLATGAGRPHVLTAMKRPEIRVPRAKAAFAARWRAGSPLRQTAAAEPALLELLFLFLFLLVGMPRFVSTHTRATGCCFTSTSIRTRSVLPGFRLHRFWLGGVAVSADGKGFKPHSVFVPAVPRWKAEANVGAAEGGGGWGLSAERTLGHRASSRAGKRAVRVMQLQTR